MAASPTTLWSVVLAAGGSRRLGSPKQFVRYHAQPLLLRAVDAAARATPRRVVVVVGAYAARMRAIIARHDRSVLVIDNPLWRDGMSTSLSAGLAAIPASAEAALLLLTDQPRVSERSLVKLIGAWRGRRSAPAAADYGGQVGVPAILPRRHWRSARKLKGDVGARAILRGAGGRITTVAMPEAVLDIDTESDVDRLLSGNRAIRSRACAATAPQGRSRN